MIAFTFKADGTLQRIQSLRKKAKNPRAMMLFGGRAINNRLKKHFRDKNRSNPNKLGGKRENFWLKVGQSVQVPVVNSAGTIVEIDINDPRFAQKVFGGEIRAKRVKNLALPLEPEAYGRSPKTFEAETGIKLVFIKQRDNALLAQVKEGGALQIEYLLTPKVNQQADPTALPSEKDLTDTFVGAAEKIVQRQTEEGKEE